jgi:adenine deaminase
MRCFASIFGMEDTPTAAWLAAMPKAELHLHIDGSLQAHRLLSLAEKNKVRLPYRSVGEVEAAYAFRDLQSFLDLYYLGASVLRDEEDFYHLMRDYLGKCRDEHILHAEIMVEPQTYLPNGVPMEVFMRGFRRAIADAQREWGQSVVLILDFLRHLPEADCLAVLEMAEPWREDFAAIGLASSELGFPPEDFRALYAAARAQGYRLTAHAGEEGPPAYVRNSLDLLHVERIDHGVRSSEDPALLARLVAEQVPLTVCPLSNVRLRVFPTIAQHNILALLQAGAKVTVNSDDPAYFGGFLTANYDALATGLGMTKAQAARLARNGFDASFLDPAAKSALLGRLDAWLAVNPA